MSVIVAGNALPGNFTFLKGASIKTPFELNLPNGKTLGVRISLPGGIKNVIKLYRDYGNGWNEITSSTVGNGISSVDFSAPNELQVYLTSTKTMSFVLGVQIDQSNPTTNMETFTSGPRVNSGDSPILVKDMSYTVKSPGIVLTVLTQGPLIDELRKIILRYYNHRVVDEAKEVTEYYDFTTNGTGGFSLVSGGQLFLAGFQNVTTSVFSIVNGTTSIRVDEYGDVVVYPYAINPTSDGGGGSND